MKLRQCTVSVLLVFALGFASSCAHAIELATPFGYSGVTLRQGWQYDDGAKHEAIDYFFYSIDAKNQKIAKSFPVRAPAAGYAAWGESDTWGFYLVIAHKDKNKLVTHRTVYAHLVNEKSLTGLPSMTQPISEWKAVNAGEVLANVGTTGDARGTPHLHFEVFEGNSLEATNRLDPYAVGGFSAPDKSRHDYANCGAESLWRECPLQARQYSTGFASMVIPDPGLVEIPLFAVDSGPLVRGEVRVRLNHERYQDLSITLEDPSGTTGVVKAVGTALCGELDNKACEDFTVPLGTGRVGRELTGTWTLNVVDQLSGNPGTTNGWDLAATTHRVIEPSDDPTAQERLPVRDVWTTSVFSYDPLNHFTGCGGGLNDEELRVGGWGDYYYSLLLFDLSGISAPVARATLRLYSTELADTRSDPVSMHLDRVTADWDWTKQPLGYCAFDNERLWWVNRPDYVQELASLPAPSRPGYWEVDITSLVNAQIAGTYTNFGIQLRPTSMANKFNHFASSEHPNPAWRPKLILE